jgi:alanyl-tRNA synthetase
MEQHTGQHIVSQALMRAGSLPTVSVHFGEEHTTIELAAESVDDRTLERAEEMANGVIKENRRVILHEIDSTEASRFPLRRTPPDAGRLRIVEVDSFDWAACGGVHVASAGEVFLIKAVATERIRGRVRVHLMMGRRALRDYGRKVALAQELSRALTCGESFIADRVRELMTGARESAKELRRLRLAQAAAEADGAIASAQRVGGVTCVRQVFDAAGQEYLKAFVERVVAVPGRVVIAIDRHADGFQWIAAHSLGGRLELPAILPPLFEIAGARGGGRGARMQGAGTRSDAAAAFAEAVEAELGRRLRAGEGA